MARKTATAQTPASATPTPTPRLPPPTTAITWPSIARTTSAFSTVHDGIIQVDNFFDRATVKRFKAFLESSSSPIVLTPPAPGPPKRGNADRTNDRFGIDDPAFAKALWEDSGLKELAEEGLASPTKRRPVGLNPNIRLYRYTAGAYFGPHYDDDFFDPKTKWRSEWTLLVYLSGEEDGVKGGGTLFYPPELPGNIRGGTKTPVEVKLSRGRAVLHRHGQACVLHEGQLVEAGTKWVLRSDVMFG
ncbi:hypothetical protein RQP46_005495 [Phenoliferia psychrophenolica]